MSDAWSRRSAHGPGTDISSPITVGGRPTSARVSKGPLAQGRSPLPGTPLRAHADGGRRSTDLRLENEELPEGAR